MNEWKYKLGQKVTDTVTGFSGTITSRCDNLGGNNQYLICGDSMGPKTAKQDWFYESRLKEADAKETA